MIETPLFSVTCFKGALNGAEMEQEVFREKTVVEGDFPGGRGAEARKETSRDLRPREYC